MTHPKRNTPENEVATKKWKESMEARHGDLSEYLGKIGKKGGLARNPKKGFGSNRELAREAGRRGGAISRRGAKK